MKLYSVFSLFVVKVKNNYFICREAFKDNVYIEFFTKEKITVKDENDVECLSKYYSLLEVMDYETSEVLMLNKKQILLKYLEINDKTIEKKEKITYEPKDKYGLMIDAWQDYVNNSKDEIDIPIYNVKELKK